MLTIAIISCLLSTRVLASYEPEQIISNDYEGTSYDEDNYNDYKINHLNTDLSNIHNFQAQKLNSYDQFSAFTDHTNFNNGNQLLHSQSSLLGENDWIQHHHHSNQAVPISQHIDVTRPIGIPVVKNIGVPLPQPVAIPVPHTVAVRVPQPYPVHVPVTQPVAIPIIKTIAVPVERKVPYTIERIIPVPVEKPVPVAVEKHIPVPIEKPYPIHIPVYKHIIHKSESPNKPYHGNERRGHYYRHYYHRDGRW